MTFKFNKKKDERKALVKAISDILETPSKYLGVPSYYYTVGVFTIDPNGNVTCPDVTEGALVERFLKELAKRGYIPEGSELQPAPAVEQADTTHFVVELPIGRFDGEIINKLEAMIESKGELIKAALGTESLRYEIGEDRVSFPWFTLTGDPCEVRAYTDFVELLVKTAEAKKRVTAKTVPLDDNPRYAFRCFLLSLGFIGPEYKDTRRVLLRNLYGSSAFKNGHGKS